VRKIFAKRGLCIILNRFFEIKIRKVSNMDINYSYCLMQYVLGREEKQGNDQYE
jgi:hypothetical protein